MSKVILVGLNVNHHPLYKLLLKFLTTKFRIVTFLTRDTIIEQIDNLLDKNFITIIVDTGRVDKIINRNINTINGHDILLLDEYYGLFLRIGLYKFSCKKKLLLIHNSNKWLQSKILIDWKYMFDHIFKQRFFHQFDAYITMGPNIKEYFQVLKDDKPVFFFPFDQILEEIICTIEKTEKIDIVIPGMIDENRRNYKDLLVVLEKYYDNYPNSKIRIKFLGRIVNKKENNIADVSNNINKKYGIKIIYWDKFIPDNEFENEIKKADLVLSNVHVFNDLNDRVEIYGLTKESGISFVIYKYAKIAIVPNCQNMLSGFDSQLIKFDNYDDLYEIFCKIEKHEVDLEKLGLNATRNKQVFNDKIKKENIKLMNYLTEG